MQLLFDQLFSQLLGRINEYQCPSVVNVNIATRPINYLVLLILLLIISTTWENLDRLICEQCCR